MTPDDLLAATVSDVIARNPAAARVLLARGMACVGCAFAPFDTIRDVAFIYRIDALALASALMEASVATPSPEE